VALKLLLHCSGFRSDSEICEIQQMVDLCIAGVHRGCLRVVMRTSSGVNACVTPLTEQKLLEQMRSA